MTEQVKIAELEITAQALRDTLRDKEKEIEGTVKEIRKQQADRHRWLQQKNIPFQYIPLQRCFYVDFQTCYNMLQYSYVNNINEFVFSLVRITIRENVDLIRLQKQLSEKSTALRVTQEKFKNLQEVS